MRTIIPPQSRNVGIWGSDYYVPKAMFYLLEGDYSCQLFKDDECGIS